jgi:uncharacterized membrane protein
MKTSSRLFWTLPYILTTYFFLKLILKEEGCWGMIEAWESIFLSLILVITGIIALVVAFRKRKSDKLKFEPITSTLIVLTTSIIFICIFWGDTFKPKTWLYAVVNVQDFSEIKHSLTLRNDKTYKVRITAIETRCDYLGRYSISGDTVFLDNDISQKTEGQFVDKYFLKNNKLTPIINLVDTLKSPWQLSVTQP